MRLDIHQICTGIAFWTAIILVIGYPLLLLLISFEVLPPTAFFVFLTLHASALALGYRYDGSASGLAS